MPIKLTLTYDSLADLRRDMEQFLWPVSPTATAPTKPTKSAAKKPAATAPMNGAEPAEATNGAARDGPPAVEKAGFTVDPVLAAVPIEQLLTDPPLPEPPATIPVRADYAGLVPGPVDDSEEDMPRRGRGRPPGSRNRRGAFELGEMPRPPVQAISPLPPIDTVEFDPAMTLAPNSEDETPAKELTAYDLAMALGGATESNSAADQVAAQRIDLEMYYNRLVVRGNHTMALGLLRGAAGNDRLNGPAAVPDDRVDQAIQALQDYLEQ